MNRKIICILMFTLFITSAMINATAVNIKIDSNEATDFLEEDGNYIDSNGLNTQTWPMQGYNPQRTGLCPYDTSDNLGEMKWRYDAGEPIETAPIIDSDGTIYFGCWDGCLYAVNPDGMLKWKFDTGSPIETSSPAIADDGTIYIGTYDGYNDSNNYFFAINSDGTEKWKIQTARARIASSPVIAPDGTIYVAFNEHLYAINPDGTIKWDYYIESVDTSSPAIGHDGTIYIGSESLYPHLYAINSDGTEKWKLELFDRVESSPAVGADGTIYVGTCRDYEPYENYFYAINPDGTIKWQKWVMTMFPSPAIGADGTIYCYCVLEEPGKNSDYWYLQAFDPDGSLKWKYKDCYYSSLDTKISSPVIGADGTIYFGMNDINAVDPNGNLKWTIGVVWATSPAIGSDGTIYIGSFLGDLSAIHTRMDNEPPNVPSISGPPASKPGMECEYSAVATDPEGEDICYYFYFGWWLFPPGSGCICEAGLRRVPETGYVPSGTIVNTTRIWNHLTPAKKIVVFAKDIHGYIGEMSDPIKTTMPRDRERNIDSLFLQFLKNHPNLFPLFQRLLGLLP